MKKTITAKEIKKIDSQLLRATTFSIIGKEQLKKEVCDLIDKRFKFLEKNLILANDAIGDIKRR